MSEKLNYLASDFKMKYISTLKRYLFSLQQKGHTVEYFFFF